jgi:hypothetical protein
MTGDMIVMATSTFLQVLFATMIAVPVVILWVAAVADVLRTGGGGLRVAGMLVLILVVPILGPLLYFALRKPPAGDAEAILMAQEDLRRETARRPVGGAGLH